MILLYLDFIIFRFYHIKVRNKISIYQKQKKGTCQKTNSLFKILKNLNYQIGKTLIFSSTFCCKTASIANKVPVLPDEHPEHEPKYLIYKS